MPSTVVADASLVIKWILPEEGSEEAIRMVSQWAREGVRAVVPTLLWTEVSNVLHRRVVSGELREPDAEKLLKSLFHVGMITRSEVGLCPRALHIAHTFKLSNAYDAIYLALAEAEEALFWTADEKLHRAVADKLTWVHCVMRRATK